MKKSNWEEKLLKLIAHEVERTQLEAQGVNCKDGGRILKIKLFANSIEQAEQKAKVEGAREYKDFHIKHLKDNDTKQLRIDEENRTFKQFIKLKEEGNE